MFLQKVQFLKLGGPIGAPPPNKRYRAYCISPSNIALRPHSKGHPLFYRPELYHQLAY